MTHLRSPRTLADAITTVAALIGWDTMCRITGRKDRTVREWSLPHRRSSPTFDQAVALDTAYVAAGGDGRPLFEAYAHQLDVQVDAAIACERALLADAALVAKEAGEAVHAAFRATVPGASPLDRIRAHEEADHAHRATGSLLKRLTSFLPSGAGPKTGKTGGHQ